MRNKFWLIIIAALVLLPSVVLAQSVQQSGTVTPGHAPYWVTNGVVGDGGTSAAPNINTLGIRALGGTPFCILNNLPTTSYSKLCMGVSSTAAYITLDSFGGASALPLQFIINGVTYSIPSIFVSTVRKITTGTSDSATTADGTIAWNSATTGAKAQTIYACSSAVSGATLTIKDEIGTGQTYNITITPASGTIDGDPNTSIAVDYGAVQLQCDGGSNWMIL